MKATAKYWCKSDVSDFIASLGSASLGNGVPKKLMGYFENIEPMIPETGITIMQTYKKKWFMWEIVLFQPVIDAGKLGGGFFSLQTSLKTINKDKSIPKDLWKLNHKALGLSGPFGISTIKIPMQSWKTSRQASNQCKIIARLVYSEVTMLLFVICPYSPKKISKELGVRNDSKLFFVL